MKNNEDYYGEKEYSIKENNDVYHIDEQTEFESSDKQKLIENENKNDNKLDKIEILRMIGKCSNPKYSMLYPPEVLGVYITVHSGEWHKFKLGNPEKFIDDKIVEFLSSIDREEFRDHFKNTVSNDETVSNAFKLRLNYALLLKENTDTIQIHTQQSNKLLFQDKLDEEGNYLGSLSSAKDISDEELDRLSEEFYSNKEIIKKTKNGTPKYLREHINNLMVQSGMEIDYNLNSIYYQLNKFNKENMESGLIARMAYLAFISEIDNNKIDYKPEIIEE